MVSKPKIRVILAVYIPKLAQSYVPDPKYFYFEDHSGNCCHNNFPKVISQHYYFNSYFQSCLEPCSSSVSFFNHSFSIWLSGPAGSTLLQLCFLILPIMHTFLIKQVQPLSGRCHVKDFPVSLYVAILFPAQPLNHSSFRVSFKSRFLLQTISNFTTSSKDS